MYCTLFSNILCFFQVTSRYNRKICVSDENCIAFIFEKLFQIHFAGTTSRRYWIKIFRIVVSWTNSLSNIG